MKMLKLGRLRQEPILSPTDNWWESKAVFNPAAALLGEQVILLYRAVGGDNISRFGLARSKDGISFLRSSEPIFEADANVPLERLGIEDPRVVKLGSDFLINYTGVAVYSIKEKKELTWQRKIPWKVRSFVTRTKDFQTFSHEELIFNKDQKDLAIFPERINGQYAMLIRIYPDICISSSADLKNWSEPRKILSSRPGFWDSERIGSGAPPIRTEVGWLHFYHGVNDKSVYSLGLVILDLDNPEKVLYRSDEPILEPELAWEKAGLVPNVVFSCGTVEKNGQYLVYYGAADKVIGVASIGKDELLTELKKEIKT